MCWTCNPYCGGCKPPKEKPIPCPACGYYNISGRKTCKKCGTELPPPKPRPTVQCLYINKLCANPCNRYKNPPQDGMAKTCKWHTPPKDLLETSAEG